MNISLRRTTLRAIAALVLGAMLTGGAVLTSGVLAAPDAGAATPTPPWEPVGNPPVTGGLLFFNSLGQQITGGSTTTAPFAAYVEGTSVIDASDTVATLDAYTPVHGAPVGDWSGEQISQSTTYPNAKAPAPLNTSTLPVVTGQTIDTTLTTYELAYPNTDISDDGYAGLYVLRLVTSAPGKSATTSYDSADIEITGDTWSVVYPTSAVAVTTTQTSPQEFGTDVTFHATVSPSIATGTVQFKDGTADIGSPVPVTSGTASITTSSLTVGTHLINAVFSSTDATVSGSTGNTPFTVTPAPTTTTLTTTPSSPREFGTTVTLKATVSPSTAPGKVQFEYGTGGTPTDIGSPVTVSAGKASITTSTLPVGDDTLYAVFVPTADSGYTGSTGTTSFTVTDISTSTTITTTQSSPREFGTSVTLKATVSPSTAPGKVQFEYGTGGTPTDIGSPVTVSAGKASITTSTLPVGDDTLYAVFTPTSGSGYTGSTGTTSFTVTDISTSTTITTTQSSPQYSGTTVTLKATVSPSTAPGKVQFEYGTGGTPTDIGSPVTVSAGKASVTTSTLPVGDDTLYAVFTPTSGSGYSGSTGTTPFTVVALTPTTTAITTTQSSPREFGTTVTLKATVSPSAAPGKVQFEYGTGGTPTDIGSPVTVSAGKASVTTSALPVGDDTLYAVFTPTSGSGYTGSTGTTPFTVTDISTSTTITTTQSSPQYSGTTVTLKATVSPSTAPGKVQFEYGTGGTPTDIGSPVSVSAGKASITTSALPVGDDTLYAVFTPTSGSGYSGSTGTTPFTVVALTPTITAITTTQSSPKEFGTSVTLKATVSPSTAPGKVQFEYGTGGTPTDIGSPVTVSAGKASVTTSALPVGDDTLYAVFTPTSGSGYTGSTGTTPFTVTDISTSTTITTTQSSPQYSGTTVTLKATVSPSAAPGKVQFEYGTGGTPTDIGSPVTVSAGKASVTTSALPVGDDTLYAVFTPTSGSSYSGSTGTTPFTVTDISTSTTITTTQSSPQYSGTTVTLKATVSPSAAPGKVQFEYGTGGTPTDIGSPVTVSAGKASVTTSALPVGDDTLYAVFTPTSGSSYTGSTGTTPFTVKALTATTTTLTASPASPQVSGTSVTLTATVTAGVDGTVQFENGSTDLGSPVTVSGGTATYVTTALPVGTLTLNAVFTPVAGSGYTSSTGTASYTVTATAVTPPPPPAGATSSDGASSSSPTGTATAGVTGLSASGSGEGALTVATYSGNPVVGTVSGGTGVYYDVAVSSGSSFGSLTITITDLGPGGQSIDWWNGTAWVPFSDQTFDAATDSVTATVDATTSPTLAQLTGTEVAASTNPAPSLGYWLVGADGGVFAYNGAQFYGSTGGLTLNKPIVGLAATPDGKGYWLVASDGGVFAYGDATFYGSTGGLTLNKPIVGIAVTPDGKGYWLVASDGGVFAYGDATFYGSTGGLTLNKPIVGIAVTPDGKGYWLVASDGGVFAYGDAQFYGSTGGLTLDKPIVGIAATPDGKGYWLVASDGGVFAYGDATFYGSTGGLTLDKPIVGIAATASGQGYWLVASDGGVFAYGDAQFYGSTGGTALNKPIVGLAGT